MIAVEICVSVRAVDWRARRASGTFGGVHLMVVSCLEPFRLAVRLCIVSSKLGRMLALCVHDRSLGWVGLDLIVVTYLT